ncbi:MAG: hypothetical protein ACI4OL_02385, partial [Gemmiger sp.]
MIHRLRVRAFLPVTFLLLGVLLLAFPQAVHAGFRTSLSLCISSLAPALFPFFVVSALLTSCPDSEWLGRPLRPLCRLYGIQSDSAPLALLLSWLGGYTVCMQVLAQCCAERRMTTQDAQRLATLGFCSSPGFVVGCIGSSLLGNVKFGVALYLMQLLANLPAAALTNLFFRHERNAAVKPAGHVAQNKPVVPDFPAAINCSVSSMLSVCGCVLFFGVLCQVLEQFFPLSGAAEAAFRALFEVTSGCAAFVQYGGLYAFYGLGFCLSFPGISVLSQLFVLARGQFPLSALII